jgi:hypothetical protein
VTGYRIYHGTVPGGPYPTKIDVPVPQVEYPTTFPLNTVYYITLTARNAEGLESPPTDELTLPKTEIELWRRQYFNRDDNAGDAADLANPLGDGIPNIIKFACWYNPVVPLAPEKWARKGVLSLTKTYARFTYYRSRGAMNDGIQYAVEWSNTMKPGSWVAGGTETVKSTADYDIVVNTKARNGAARKFARLRVTKPDTLP